MAFLALNIESQCLTQEKSSYEYDLLVMTNKYNETLEELNSYIDGGGSSEDSTATQLQAQQELYDSQKDSLESRLEVINNELESYSKAVTTNVKNDCKFSISA